MSNSKHFNKYLKIDGEDLDGSVTVSNGDNTDALRLSDWENRHKSFYFVMDTLSSGDAEVTPQITDPDGTWHDYHQDLTYTITEENKAFPLMFESEAEYLRFKFDLQADTSLTAWICERR